MRATSIIVDKLMAPHLARQVVVKEVISIAEFDKQNNKELAKHPYICIFNGKALLRNQWDDTLIRHGDVVAWISFPRGGKASNIVKIIVGVILIISAYWCGPQNAVMGASMIAGGVMGLVMTPPLPPSQQQAPASSPVYTLGAQGNQARLGKPIPDVYGRHLVYPDFGAQPYSEFVGDDQYLYEMFVIGHGEYEFETIRIADTPIENFEEVSYQIVGPGEKVTLFPVDVHSNVEVSGQELFTNNAVGSFVANGSGTETDKIGCDLICPRGLCYANDSGGLDSKSVTVEFEAQEIDDDGVAIGNWIHLGTEIITGKTYTPIRKTYFYPVTPGRYQVRATRLDTKDTNSRACHSVAWGGLRGYIPGDQQYGNVTVLAIKMRATNNLSNRASRQINAIVKRKLRKWDSASQSWSAPVFTRNPAWAIANIAFSSYGGNVAENRVNLDRLYELSLKWEQTGDKFDGVFDNAQSLFEAIQAVASVGRSQAFLQAGILTVARDEPSTVPVAMFSPFNIVEKTFSIEYSTPTEETPDYIVVEYFDKDYWTWKTVDCKFADSTAVNPFHQRFFGVVEREQAWRLGIFMAACNRWRRIRATWDTELEGHIPTIFDLVALSHDMPGWGQSGQIVAWDATTKTVTCSEPLEWSEGTHYMALRRFDGSWSGNYVATQVAGDDYKAILDTDPDFTPYTGNDAVRTLYQFGSENKRDFKVLSVVPGDKDILTIQAMGEDVRVYEADGNEVIPVGVNPWPLVVVADTPQIDNLIVVQSGSPSAPRLNLSWTPAPGADHYVIEYTNVAQNLLTHSNELDDWTLDDVVVTANSGIGPDGENNLWKLEGGSSSANISNSFVPEAGAYTQQFSLYFREGTSSDFSVYFFLYPDSSHSGPGDEIAYVKTAVNWSDSIPSIVSNDRLGTGVASKITEIAGDGLYRLNLYVDNVDGGTFGKAKFFPALNNGENTLCGYCQIVSGERNQPYVETTTEAKNTPSQWTTVANTSQAHYSLAAPEGLIWIRVAAVGAGRGNWVYWEGNVSDILPPADVQNLQLISDELGSYFTISWDSDPRATSYEVRIIADFVVQRDTFTNITEYTYTAENAAEDGGPWRTITFQVKAVGAAGSSEHWAEVAAGNAAPAEVQGIKLFPQDLVCAISFTKPADRDFRGVLVACSDTSGFTPDLGYVVWDGTDNVATVSQFSDGAGNLSDFVDGMTYYIRLAAYDAFGKTALNWTTGEYSFAAGTYVVDSQDILQKLRDSLTDPGMQVQDGDFLFNSERFAIRKPDSTDNYVFAIATIDGEPKILLSADVVIGGNVAIDNLTTGALPTDVRMSLGDGSVVIDGQGFITVYDGPDSQENRNYVLLQSGDIDFFKYINGQYQLYKSLQRRESGTAQSGETVLIPGYFIEEPTVMVSPASIKLFDASYNQQSQSISILANNLQEYPSGSKQWRFDAVAQLQIDANSGSTAVNANSGVTSSNSWNTATQYLPNNTDVITVKVRFSSTRGTGNHTHEYYYRQVRVRVYTSADGSSWSARYDHTFAIGAQINTLISQTLSNLSIPSGHNRFYVRFDASDAGGTFSKGADEYNYANHTTPTLNDPANLPKACSTRDIINQSQLIENYSPPSGYSVYRTDYTMEIEHYYGCPADSCYHAPIQLHSGTWGSCAGSGQSRFYDNGNLDFTSPNTTHCYYPLGTDVQKQVTSTGTSWDGYYRRYLCGADSDDPSGMGKINWIYAKIYSRKLITNSSTPQNQFIVDNYDWHTPSANVLATGSLNWSAVGR